MFNNKDKNSTMSQNNTSKFDTLLGQHTSINGDLEFTGILHLDGAIKGSLKGTENDDTLTVSENGRIEGKIEVKGDSAPVVDMFQFFADGNTKNWSDVCEYFGFPHNFHNFKSFYYSLKGLKGHGFLRQGVSDGRQQQYRLSDAMFELEGRPTTAI